MPTKRRRVTRQRRRALDLSVDMRRFLETGVYTGYRGPERLPIYVLAGDRNRLPALWRDVEGDFVATWVAIRPGTRPWAWWTLSAPRLVSELVGWETPPTWFSRETAEPRRQLGGHGVPSHERYNLRPRFRLGLPVDWCEVDPDDAPTFESQAAYLARHGLFVPGERERLTDEDFEPEVIEDDDDEKQTTQETEAC